jgi:carbon monoxide dehydrogenase subunit G
MKISNSFRIPVPPDQAWDVLNDVPRVARCAPGAQLLEQREDGAYVGTVAVRLGPVALSFKGTFSYKEKDPVARRVVAEAAGNEAKARGTARANVVFVLAPDPVGTKVDVDSDVQLAGSIAQYGRGAALIQSTAQVIIDQFATNLAKEFNAGTPAAAVVESVPEVVAEVPAAEPVVAPAAETVVAPAAEPVTAPVPPAPVTPKVFAPAPVAKPISMTSVLWQGFLGWLKGLFGGKR